MMSPGWTTYSKSADLTAELEKLGLDGSRPYQISIMLGDTTIWGITCPGGPIRLAVSASQGPAPEPMPDEEPEEPEPEEEYSDI